MTPTTSNTVAVDRRLDLASLFCMIARHGPAVALAVVALVSVLAGFIIYRSVREKRRKATDDDDKHSAAERDLAAVPGLEPGPEESHSSAVSTGVGDEGLPGMKDDPDLDQGDLNIRHRRAAAATAATAAERKFPIYSPPKSDIQIPANRDITSNDTQEITTVQVPYKAAEAYAVEVIQNLQCDNHTLADMEMEGAADCHQGATDDTVQDMIQEIHSNDNCLKVAELINSESHQKDEKVFKAEYFGDDEMTIEEDVSDEKNRKKMENLQCASNSQVSFNQTSSMSENVDDDKLQDNKNTLETNFGESILYAEDISVTCISYSKDGKSVKEDCHPESIDKFVKENHHPESIDGSSYISNHFSAEEQEKNEGEETKEECVDQQLLEQDETWSLTCEQEPKLPCSQQDQCDHISDKVVLPNNTSEWGDDGGQASVPQPDKPQQHIKVNENVITCNQENNNLLTVADQVTEKMLISGNSVSCDEECHNSSVVLSPTLHCVSEHAKVDNGDDDDLSGATTDGKAKLSGIGELDYQQTQSVVREEEITPPLEKDTDLTILGSDLPSLKTKVPDNENQSDVVAVLAEESIDLHAVSCYKDQQLGQMVNKDNIIVPAVPNSDAENNIASIMAEKISVLSCYKDQQSVQTKPNEAFEECGVASGPGTVPENVTSLVTGEEMSCPYLPSMCQNQESEHVEMSETFDEAKITSATDRAVCGNISLMNPVMTEEISRPDMLSFCQDQQSDQMQNSKDFTDLVIGAASVLTKDQSPGVGAESGISSMTVSPDLHVAGDEFDMNIADAVLPTMDCDPQSEDRAVAQSSLLADDLDIPVINVDTAGMVSRSYTSCLSQQSEHADGVKYASLAANEDMFGNEIEERYQRAMEPFVAQIAADAVIKTDELQTDIKAVVEVVEIKEKKKGVSVAKKIETEAEKETEEDYEKTEISIMEATMDNNEWIMDSNYQVLPWMNPSVPHLTQDDTKTELPTENHFPTDATCVESDTPPTECKQTTTLPLSDENMENNKKVLAVQPMPQNVNVTFRIHYLTHSPYQTVAITGNHQELGNWKEFIPLESAKDGHWATVVSLPAESHVEWKFVVLDKGEVCRWEECGNRLLDTGYGDDLIVHKWWGFL